MANLSLVPSRLPQSSLTEVRSLSWSVQLPVALTVNGAWPEVGETESVQFGEAACAASGRKSDTNPMTSHFLQFRIPSIPATPFTQAPGQREIGHLPPIRQSHYMRCYLDQQGY
ncbi:MAG: hypothetical protein L0Z53_14450 [Acidobacteriales bacterium]|nr:hypothetical protein [Terriglobales bacterium]